MWDHETIMMIVQGVGETLYMTVLSTVLGYLLDFPWECCWQYQIKGTETKCSVV